MKSVALFLLLGLLSCRPAVEPESFQGSQDPALLLGEPWRLEQIASPSGTDSPAQTRFTILFTAGGTVHGAAGPNGYGGPYAAAPTGDLRIGEVTSTLIGGPEADRAAKYLALAVQAHSFKVTSTELRLYFGQERFLHFRRDTQS